MAKPIAVIYIPSDLLIFESAPRYRWADCANFQKKLEAERPDYYWFVFLQNDISGIQLQVFHEKDFTDIQYDELKKMIEENIKQQS